MSVRVIYLKKKKYSLGTVFEKVTIYRTREQRSALYSELRAGIGRREERSTVAFVRSRRNHDFSAKRAGFSSAPREKEKEKIIVTRNWSSRASRRTAANGITSLSDADKGPV